MAKPEWGVKRVCQSCAAKFYDLKRSPITCPKCATPFDPEALLKSRRSRPTPAAKTAKPAPEVAAKKPPADDAVPGDGEAGDGEAGDGKADDQASSRPDDDKDDSTVLQDTSDLGGDGTSEVVVPSKDEDN